MVHYKQAPGGSQPNGLYNTIQNPRQHQPHATGNTTPLHINQYDKLFESYRHETANDLSNISLRFLQQPEYATPASPKVEYENQEVARKFVDNGKLYPTPILRIEPGNDRCFIVKAELATIQVNESAESKTTKARKPKANYKEQQPEGRSTGETSSSKNEKVFGPLTELDLPKARLLGKSVSSPYRIQDEDILYHDYFIFDKLLVHANPGQYQLQFNLYYINGVSDTVYLDSVDCMFTVRPLRQDPGKPESSALMKKLHNGGMRVDLDKECKKRKLAAYNQNFATHLSTRPQPARGLSYNKGFINTPKIFPLVVFNQQQHYGNNFQRAHPQEGSNKKPCLMPSSSGVAGAAQKCQIATPYTLTTRKQKEIQSNFTTEVLVLKLPVQQQFNPKFNQQFSSYQHQMATPTDNSYNNPNAMHSLPQRPYFNSNWLDNTATGCSHINNLDTSQGFAPAEPSMSPLNSTPSQAQDAFELQKQDPQKYVNIQDMEQPQENGDELSMSHSVRNTSGPPQQQDFQRYDIVQNM